MRWYVYICVVYERNSMKIICVCVKEIFNVDDQLVHIFFYRKLEGESDLGIRFLIEIKIFLYITSARYTNKIVSFGIAPKHIHDLCHVQPEYIIL